VLNSVYSDTGPHVPSGPRDNTMNLDSIFDEHATELDPNFLDEFLANPDHFTTMFTDSGFDLTEHYVANDGATSTEGKSGVKNGGLDYFATEYYMGSASAQHMVGGGFVPGIDVGDQNSIVRLAGGIQKPST
jgi:hypothetical protein